MDFTRQIERSCQCRPCKKYTKHIIHDSEYFEFTEAGNVYRVGTCTGCNTTHRIPFNGNPYEHERQKKRICRVDYGGCGKPMNSTRYFICQECADDTRWKYRDSGVYEESVYASDLGADIFMRPETESMKRKMREANTVRGE